MTEDHDHTGAHDSTIPPRLRMFLRRLRNHVIPAGASLLGRVLPKLAPALGWLLLRYYRKWLESLAFVTFVYPKRENGVFVAGKTTVHLDRLFVKPSLEKAAGVGWDFEAFDEGRDSDKEAPSMPDDAPERVQKQGLSLDSMLESLVSAAGCKAEIVAVPGGGKSTLLYYVTRRLLAGEERSSSNGAPLGKLFGNIVKRGPSSRGPVVEKTAAPHRLPVYVDLAEFCRELETVCDDPAAAMASHVAKVVGGWLLAHTRKARCRAEPQEESQSSVHPLTEALRNYLKMANRWYLRYQSRPQASLMSAR